MSTVRYQQSAQRFTAFFNRLTKARLAGTPLAPAIADAVGHELSTLDAAVDLPASAAPMWTGFLARYLGLAEGKPPPSDPLGTLRALPDDMAEEALAEIGEIQMRISEALKRG